MTGPEGSGERHVASPCPVSAAVPRAVYYALASNVIVALQFFLAGGLGAVGIGVWRLWRHTRLEHAWVAIGVLVVSALVEGRALRASIRPIDRNRRAGGLWHWFHETSKLEVMLAIGEDAAALAGVLVSPAGIGHAAFTGEALFDALGSIGVGMVMTALVTLREIKSLIVGEAARRRDREAIRAWFEARPEIEHSVSLVVLRWSDRFVVAVQARLAAHQSADDLVRTIDRLEIALQEAFPLAR